MGEGNSEKPKILRFPSEQVVKKPSQRMALSHIAAQEERRRDQLAAKDDFVEFDQPTLQKYYLMSNFLKQHPPQEDPTGTQTLEEQTHYMELKRQAAENPRRLAEYLRLSDERHWDQDQPFYRALDKAIEDLFQLLNEPGL